MIRLRLPDLAATERLAARVAAMSAPGEAILLSGGLGAGKSAFARAFLRAWTGEPALEVPSPTFTLVQPYDGPPGQAWHCDLYRIADPEEVAELGIGGESDAVLLIVEWPDRLGDWRPADRLELTLEICQQDEDARLALLTGYGAWRERMTDLDDDDD